LLAEDFQGNNNTPLERNIGTTEERTELQNKRTSGIRQKRIAEKGKGQVAGPSPASAERVQWKAKGKVNKIDDKGKSKKGTIACLAFHHS